MCWLLLLQDNTAITEIGWLAEGQDKGWHVLRVRLGLVKRQQALLGSHALAVHAKLSGLLHRSGVVAKAWTEAKLFLRALHR